MMKNNAFAVQMCIVVVVVTNESNMASYFPKVGNLNGSNADMCSDVAGLSSTGLCDLFELSDRSNETMILQFPPKPAPLAAILDLNMTSTPMDMPSGHVTSSCIRSIVRDFGKSRCKHLKWQRIKKINSSGYCQYKLRDQ